MFGQDSNHRDPITVLEGFSKTLKGFHIDYALFTIFPGQRGPRITGPDTSTSGTPEQKITNFADTYTELWKKVHPETTIIHEHSVEDALKRTETLSRETEGGLDVLVTGSQLLTGGALKYLKHRI